MPTSWPDNPKVINGRHLRLDGMAKASGKAKYPSDVHPEGLLFGALLYSPHPHAKIKAIDLEPALKMPGVKAAVLLPSIKAGSTVRFVGDTIAAVAAETEEQACDAARAIKVDYEILPHVATEEQAVSTDAPQIVRGNGIVRNTRKGRSQVNGNPEEALTKADAVIEGIYTAPVITHVCLEPHGLTVQWKPDSVEAWASTQAVGVTAGELAGHTGLPQSKVMVHTEVMGGGFGSKFGADAWGLAGADLSKAAGGRPVRMFLDRTHEHLTAGNRPSVNAKVKIGASKDGKIVGLIAETSGTGGVGAGRISRSPTSTTSQPRRVRTRTSSSTPATPARCGRRGTPRRASSWNRRSTTWPPSSAWTRLSSGSRISKTRTWSPTPSRSRRSTGRRSIATRSPRAPSCSAGRTSGSREGSAARGRSSAASAWRCTNGAAAGRRPTRSRAPSTRTAPSR